MLTDVSDYIVYELAVLKGEKVRFCRYRYYDSDFNEGYVIVSDYNSFFVRIETQVIDDKYEIHFLIIKAFQNIEIDEAFTFVPVFEGILKDITLMKSTVSGLEIDHHAIQDITTEAAMLLEFENEDRILIHQCEDLYTSTGYTDQLDALLDVMIDKGLKRSRVAEKDITLLQCWQ